MSFCHINCTLILLVVPSSTPNCITMSINHTALRSLPTRRSPLLGSSVGAGVALLVSCFPHLSDSTSIPPILLKQKPLL